MTTPAPVFFEIIGKDGKSMVYSLNDSVKISYNDNNQLKSFTLTIMKMEVATQDASAGSLKYNGFCITDNAKMSDLSSRVPNPIHNFNLSFNRVNIGAVYLDYQNYLNAYPKLSSSTLTFNNIPVNQDNSITIKGGGNYNLNLLQVQ